MKYRYFTVLPFMHHLFTMAAKAWKSPQACTLLFVAFRSQRLMGNGERDEIMGKARALSLREPLEISVGRS